MTIGPRYNEAFDECGNIRAPYSNYRARTGNDPLSPSTKVAADLMTAPLGDRYSILPIPLVLDDREYQDVIVAGVRQRALALQALFFDLINGDTRVFRDTSLPKTLFPHMLDQQGIALRDLASWWRGKSREAVRFTYAPDLVRGPDGRWIILEDNLGCVGGVVDSGLAVERFLACTGSRLHPSVGRESNLARAVCDFLERVERTPANDDVFALLGDECSSDDPEAVRKREVLAALGLRVFTTRQLEDAKPKRARIPEVRAIVNFSTAGWNRTSSVSADLFCRDGVALMTAPGIDSLGNKALLPFMDEVVAFYSSAEPILRAAETVVCRRLPADPREWVLKRSNGRQGREVFFLETMSAVERLRLDSLLDRWGTIGSALQRRVNASCLSSTQGPWSDEFQVELRPFVFAIGDAQCVVGEHVSGRAFRNTDGRGLGNMSRGACYLTVVREPASSVQVQFCTQESVMR